MQGFLAILSILITYFILFFIFSGVGLFVSTQIKYVLCDRLSDLLLHTWLGFVLTISILQIWNLFFPVNNVIRFFILLMATLGLYQSRLIIIKLCRPVLSWRLGVFCLFVIWVAHHAVVIDIMTIGYDTGLYHMQSLKWILHSPSVPGLALIHGRLAFNNAFAFYPALFAVGPLANMTHHIAYSFLYLLGFATVTNFYFDTEHRLVRPFMLLCLPLLLYVIFFGEIHGLNTDPSILLFQILSLCIFIFISLDTPTLPRRLFLYLITLWALLGLSIAIKLSAAVFSVGLTLLSWHVLLKKYPKNWKWITGIGVLLFSLLILPSIVRTIIVSGYLIYPYSVTALDVEWQIPKGAVDVELAWIQSWARQTRKPPSEVLANWDWFYDYWFWNVMNGTGFWQVMLPVLIFCYSSLLFVFKRKRAYLSFDLIGLMTVLMSAIAFWFFSAPAPRFAGATIWGVALVIFLIAISGLSPTYRRRNIICVVGIMFLFCLPPYIWEAIDEGFSPIPEVELTTLDVNGLTFYTLSNGDQCWDAPLPCGPRIRQTIEMYDINNISAGFYLPSP